MRGAARHQARAVCEDVRPGTFGRGSVVISEREDAPGTSNGASRAGAASQSPPGLVHETLAVAKVAWNALSLPYHHRLSSSVCPLRNRIAFSMLRR
jgi:hypothetical protein